MLLAASIVTLILDMGGGPVFIVYASMNLNKNASIPAATWLLVFLSVIISLLGSGNLKYCTIYNRSCFVCYGLSD